MQTISRSMIIKDLNYKYKEQGRFPFDRKIRLLNIYMGHARNLWIYAFYRL